ncbi:MAG: winged helix-turn-helix domain-containing protein [Candidatus Bathyarchaeales archaeon]
MGSYRSRVDIIADILKVVRDDGARKTQIMYGANLSYSVLLRYLRIVLDACLVRFEEGRRCYVLTARGREFLERYREYSMRSKHLERQLRNMRAERRVLEGLCSV